MGYEDEKTIITPGGVGPWTISLASTRNEENESILLAKPTISQTYCVIVGNDYTVHPMCVINYEVLKTVLGANPN